MLTKVKKLFEINVGDYQISVDEYFDLHINNEFIKLSLCVEFPRKEIVDALIGNTCASFDDKFNKSTLRLDKNTIEFSGNKYPVQVNIKMPITYDEKLKLANCLLETLSYEDIVAI